MATKRIARCLFESGNNKCIKNEWRQQNKQDRLQVKRFLDKVKQYPERADDLKEPTKNHKWGWDEGNGMTGVISRFLESHLGEPWNEIYSLIREKFDRRTYEGYKVAKFIKMKVCGSGEKEYRPDNHTRPCMFDDYFVDDNGLLNKSPKGSRAADRKAYKEKQKIISDKKLMSEFILFLDKRKIGFVDGVLWWFVDGNAKHFNIEFQTYKFVWVEKGAGNESWAQNKMMFYNLKFEKGYRLTKEEVQKFRSFPEILQRYILNSMKKEKDWNW